MPTTCSGTNTGDNNGNGSQSILQQMAELAKKVEAMEIRALNNKRTCERRMIRSEDFKTMSSKSSAA